MPQSLGDLHRSCAEMGTSTLSAELVAGIIMQVRVAPDQVALTCSTTAIADLLLARQNDHAPAEVVISLDARLTRSGRVLRLVHAGRATEERVSPSLMGLLVQAHRWWAELRKGELEIKALASREGVSGSYPTRVLRLAFLSPSITQAILAGRQPAVLDVRALTLNGTTDASWAAQASVYGHVA